MCNFNKPKANYSILYSTWMCCTLCIFIHKESSLDAFECLVSLNKTINIQNIKGSSKKTAVCSVLCILCPFCDLLV